jgi:NAD+ synthase (glutamine-hydrolysing)
MATVRIALAQYDFPVGAIAENVDRILALACGARGEHDARLLLLPELALSGYLAEDLFLRPGYLAACARELERLAAGTRSLDIDLVVGHPLAEGGKLYNAASWLRDGRLIATYRKQALPNYTVFDEKRYFDPGDQHIEVELGGVRFGLAICEDIWEEGRARQARRAGVDALLVLNASPFDPRNRAERIDVATRRAREHQLPIAYVNLVGGQDDLVFDGGAMAVDAGGHLVGPAPAFEDGLYCIDYDPVRAGFEALDWPASSGQEVALLYRGLVRATRDYVRKNRFDGVLLGLSGGIDSALTLAIAVDALGPGAVTAVMMPSRYTASLSIELAQAQAQLLGVACHRLSIEPPFDAFQSVLEPVFRGRAPDITEENLQSRCRGVLLMALSNKLGSMVLSTGNKSEMAVGYATIYGDMCGGFAPLKDCYKTTVYALARHRNAQSPVIPRGAIERAPSAELRHDQTDQDSLPPYELLDQILTRFIEDDLSPEAIVAQGYDEATVRRVVSMVLRSEYKRRQSAPGPRITRRAFGRDRRYPISSSWRGA